MFWAGSLRTLRAPALRASARAPNASRGLHMSKVVRASHEPTSEAQTAHYPAEGAYSCAELTTGFNSRLWIAFPLVIAGVIGVQFMQRKNQKAEAKGNDFTTSVSQFIGSLVNKTDETRAANQEHLDLAIKRAESRLVLQDAQKPAAHRYRFTPYVWHALTYLGHLSSTRAVVCSLVR